MTESSHAPFGFSALSVLVSGSLLYLLGACVYRIWFHPLAKFPGPKLAAITTWYEGYYDALRYKGRFTFKLADLHEKYGPIVRIGPNELHIKDPEYFGQLYSMSNNKLDKFEHYYSMLGNPTATFPTLKYEVHKVRRAALSPLFSPAATDRIRPVVQKVADRLTERMQEAISKGESIPLFFAFRCLTVDIICEYLYGKQMHLLDREDWGRSFYSAWRSLWEMSPLIRQIPSMMAMFRLAPRWLLAISSPKALEVIDMEVQTNVWTREALETDPAKAEKGTQKTLLWEMAHSEILPPHEKTQERLAVDSNSILAAGFETTGNTLSHLTYHVLEDPEVHKRLFKELEDAIPDPSVIPSHRMLEKLPYLNAVVKESLRVSVGAYGRLARVSRNQELRYKDWVIPAGTGVGMSCLYVEHDPVIFPNPTKFDPERWLAPGASERLDPYFCPFGKGARMCVGLNLAYAELYTVFATVIRRFPTLKLFDTSPEDVIAIHDYFGGMWKYEEGDWGLQVKG